MTLIETTFKTFLLLFCNANLVLHIQYLEKELNKKPTQTSWTIDKLKNGVTVPAGTIKSTITLIQSVEYLQTQNLSESGGEGQKNFQNGKQSGHAISKQASKQTQNNNNKELPIQLKVAPHWHCFDFGLS